MVAANKLAAYADRVLPLLDTLTYYQLLNVPPGADVPTMRASFYRAAAQLHPDSYNTLEDAALKERLETIYARICEGYRVLGNPEKRFAYDKQLAEGQAQGQPKVRLIESEREKRGPKNPEDGLKNAEAKKFFRMAVMCLAKNDFRGAVMNLNFARTFEPAAAVLAEKLALAQAGLKGAGARK